ncbi:MAG: hypothetical protein QOI60_749, partial [Actinomycetota bacterium]|nr:hypothetical protein [Actinomycetota bacterium]
VLLSSEVEELTGLCDRVAVFHAGSCSALLRGDEVTRENLVAAYFGKFVRREEKRREQKEVAL